jgi:sulfur carrier protein
MNLEVNFAPECWPETELTVRRILERKGWSFPLIIVRINGVHVRREDWDTAVARDGDKVEMYHLVSGG